MFISFASFEYIALDRPLSERLEASRKQFQRANEYFKAQYLKQDRVTLLESWLEFEKKNGTPDSIEKVEEKCPKSVKKRRQLLDDNGVGQGWEEYFDYIFPEDGQDQSSLKLVQLAHEWKMKMAQQEVSDDSDESEDEDDDE